MSTGTLLEVQGLELRLHGRTPLVQDLSFAIDHGETLALVGESGCGKSMTALAVMGLLPPGIAAASGCVMLAGESLLARREKEMSDIRGRRMAMIFQEPMTSLNPVLRIGEQIAEVVLRHERVSRDAAYRRAADLLARVRVPQPEARLRAYPHQLSGGQRQRVMIAAALACSPELLIADEPTTALDVTTQAEILVLIRELQAERGLALLLITHDLGIVASIARRVLVMYAGRRVEYGETAEVLRNPAHPYTRLLLAARPGRRTARRAKLAEIPGIVPQPQALPPGCAFAPRCPEAIEACAQAVPPERPAGPRQLAACIRVAGTA